MELHQIRYFLAVCEAGSVTRAAELCHVAQPSLTRAVKKLEGGAGREQRRAPDRAHVDRGGRRLPSRTEPGKVIRQA